jgi:hypothetical protein
LRGHPLIRGQFFYTLPRELLDHLEREVGVARFDSTLWQLERELSRINGDHTSVVGFFDGSAVSYGHLRESTLDEDAIQCLREATQGDSDLVVAITQNRLSAANRNVRAYLGWLLTERTFLEAHARVWDQIEFLVSASGMPRPVPAVSTAGRAALGLSRGTDQRESEALEELHRFCARWRLAHLQGPLLPMPLAPQFPAMNPIMAGQYARASGFGMMSIPDTMPLPSDSDLRDMMAASITRAEAEHLEPWRAIVSADNPARRTLPRYARIFESQHYVRILMDRHAAAFHRRAFKLKEALVAFFNVSEDAVKRDLRFIAGRLGPKWWEQFPTPSR